MFFDLLAVRLKRRRSRGATLVINWNTDRYRRAVPLNLENRDPHTPAGSLAENPDASVQHDSAVTLDRILCAN